MADPITLNSTQKVLGHIEGFVDAEGKPATVDSAPRWLSSDPATFVTRVTVDGMDVEIVPEDMPEDAPMKTAVLKMEVDEGGVPNAITATWDVVVSSVASPLAVGVHVTFGPPVPKAP